MTIDRQGSASKRLSEWKLALTLAHSLVRLVALASALVLLTIDIALVVVVVDLTGF